MSPLALMVATLLKLAGPQLDAVHAQAVLELPAGPQCDAPLWEQPYDCPERVRWALVAIADRESPGNYSARYRWVGRHAQDSVHDLDLWRVGHERGRKGYRRGALAWWCPVHTDPLGMSTVGPHGLIYLFNVHRLEVPGNCVPWWLFAVPSVSAEAAIDRYLQLCEDMRSSWCPTPRAVASSRRRRCDRNELPPAECRREVTAH
jgi:hypothetical protein